MAQDGAAPSENGAGVLPCHREGAAAQGRMGQWGGDAWGSVWIHARRLYMRPVPPLSLWELDVNEEKVFERVPQMFM